MTEQMDFLKEAIGSSENALAALARVKNANSDMAAAAAQRSLERAQGVATMLALLSLAQDVRRVADVLESVVEQDGERVISAAVRIWGSGNS